MTVFTRSEVAEHNSNGSAWIIIGNKVYDVTQFLDEHPGGCEVLLEKAGEDRTEAFEDIGHSTDAREMKEQFLVGEIVDDEHWKYSYDQKASKVPDAAEVKKKSIYDYGLQGVMIIVFLVIFYYLLFKSE
ncbi:cytochrome b5-like heme/Steroid binding domain-containing protein [Ditylenchus destructor]|uniref:Cytochrome b5 n=1 Tax=Ditylenchus destructor TaxID=166010 RepID=A0AAD4MX78_9BILA|nr:cytochrome b5-like heme/Steroid binding domain-containing protein [Ditylenchus destructor]